MKYIKTYESLNFTNEEDLANSAAFYLEEILPVTKEVNDKDIEKYEKYKDEYDMYINVKNFNL